MDDAAECAGVGVTATGPAPSGHASGIRSVYSAPMDGVLFLLVSYGLALLVLYGVIRLAVRHAIADADKRRQRDR